MKATITSTIHEYARTGAAPGRVVAGVGADRTIGGSPAHSKADGYAPGTYHEGSEYGRGYRDKGYRSAHSGARLGEHRATEEAGKVREISGPQGTRRVRCNPDPSTCVR